MMNPTPRIFFRFLNDKGGVLTTNCSVWGRLRKSDNQFVRLAPVGTVLTKLALVNALLRNATNLNKITLYKE